MTQCNIDFNLSGPNKNKRLSTLEALLKDESLDNETIEAALTVENVPPTITEYRDRERYLESLLKALRKDVVAQSERTQVVAFRYLLGSLYVNFEKFWGPTTRVIIDLLNQSKFKGKLLEILLNHLKETNDIIYDNAKTAELHTSDDRPDHILHRNFILQIMLKFTDVVESRSLLFMDEFFRFVDKEMLCSPFIEKHTRENLLKKSKQSDEYPDQALGMEQEDRSSEKKNLGKRSHKKSPSADMVTQKQKSKETFLTGARIIASFKDMNKVHRQNDLKELIMDLLCCRDNNVQKAAFNCLLAFDYPYIRPYVDKLLKLMNDKMVRTELTMFSVDENESCQIQDEHRVKIMPIILRVLLGKMIGRIGRKAAGRDKSELRRDLIMRFISGCRTEEVLYFFQIIFEPYFQVANIPYNELDRALESMIKLGSYAPLNKVRAMLATLVSFMETVGHQKLGALRYIFKMINIIVYYVVKPLEDPNLLSQLNERSIDSLKAIRRDCINATSQYFLMFEYYEFQQDEIDFMFKYLVWPSTKGFIDRNYANPTPILKLIEVFSGNKIYHRLLVKRNKLNTDEYLLRHLIELYKSDKTERSIFKIIASNLANIIKPDRRSEDEEEHEDEEENSLDAEKIRENKLVEDKDAIVPSYSKSLYRISNQLTFNQEILIGFIPIIFERLKRNFLLFLDKKDSNYRIEHDELIVLSSLSTYLKDPEQSSLGARLLLASLSHQKKADLIISTLKTAQVLIKQVENEVDPVIIDLIAEVLGYQRNIAQRKELCLIIKSMAEIDSNFLPISCIIELMNVTSEEFMDAPDLVKWNEGFHLAFEFLESLNEERINEQKDVKSSLILLLHQIGFMANHVDRYEFSIRENCVIFYEKLAEKLKQVDASKNGEMLELLINDILLEKFIKKGLRDTNNQIKHSYIGILRSLAIHCHERNKTLGEFHLFCSSNNDLDFWLNIKHIQLHNRSKALARICADEKITTVNPKTLSGYFMPLATGFLFSKTYKSLASLSENSIKLIGIICKQLNWVTYESTLQYYLDMLTKANATYQRTNIKLITEILKNFNFNLTTCEEAMQFEEENAKLSKRMARRLGPNEGDENTEAIAADAPSGKKLNPSTARMVYNSVTNKLLPRLNNCLHEMTRVEFEHDKKMSDYLPEKEEIKRIAIAYAIVQLLNLLPGRYVLFRDHLPQLFLKLSSFLKSKNEEVRKAARYTLIKIMVFVGPAYIPDLIRTLKQSLDKGFQIHVLNYTLHAVLHKISLSYGDLDNSTNELVNGCFQEIFGSHSEDKEIAQILAKTYEAKKTKSYDTLMILSTYISAEKLDYLMNSIKELMKTSSEPKKVHKLSMCVQRVFSGLAKNEHFPLDKMLEFIRSTIEESIPSLKIRQRVEQAERPDAGQPKREDRYLITKDLPRDRIKSKINEKGNFHMIIENCLRLLLQTFEQNKVLIKQDESVQKSLDCFITLLSSCLKSSSPRCVMRSLKCIHFIAQTRIDLPSFKTKSNSITKKIFVLLSLYNGVGMVQGDNFEMISMCFKTLTLLLLQSDYVQLNQTQIQALLSYIEQDINDTARQATAFGTLNSILFKKLEAPGLADIMDKVANLLVTSDDETIRSLATKVWQKYLLDYNHEHKLLHTHLLRFVRQLDYEFIDGRKSVVSLLSILVTRLPEPFLRNYHELIFHLLSQRLVNEESKVLRNSVGRLIGLLLQRLPTTQDHLFNKFVLQWASGDNTALQLLGIKLITVFVESSKGMFVNSKDRNKKVLNLILTALGRGETTDGEKIDEDVDMDNDESAEDSYDKKVKEVKLATVVDKLKYHSLRLFKRLIDKSLIDSVEKRHIDLLKKIWQNIAAQQMKHWHLPIVLTSCELYLVFIRKNDLTTALSVENPKSDDYLGWNAKRIVRTLCDRFIDLLDRVSENKQLIAYIMEALILLGQSISQSRSTLEFEKKYAESFEDNDIVASLLEMDDVPKDGFVEDHMPYSMSEARKNVDLIWLAVKIVMQARKEAALYKLSCNYRRDLVLRWTAAISQELGPKRLAPYLLVFLLTPVRELTDKGKNKGITKGDSSQNILTLSDDLLKFIKNLMGVENFNKIYSKVQLHYTRRRIERKQKEAILRVKDQARGVKRKLKQRKTKEATNRKKVKKFIDKRKASDGFMSRTKRSRA